MAKSLALAAALCASASAFVPVAPLAARSGVALNVKSKALPFLDAPPKLDGSMAGDAGFDPLGLSNIDDVGIDLYWMREAELKHARVAMMASAGVLWVELFGPFPGWPSPTGGSQTDAFWDAWAEKPNYIVAALVFVTVIETISGVAVTKGRETGLREPGDFKFNPLEFEINEEMRTKEIANGRLAMIAVMGEIVQGMTTHNSAIVGNLVQGI